jgi:hypothetical protein
MISDKTLTSIYNQANGITGKRLPITTARIFAAMRAAMDDALDRAARACEERGERNRIAAGLPNGDRHEFYCADDIRKLT